MSTSPRQWRSVPVTQPYTNFYARKQYVETTKYGGGWCLQAMPSPYNPCTAIFFFSFLLFGSRAASVLCPSCASVVAVYCSVNDNDVIPFSGCQRIFIGSRAFKCFVKLMGCPETEFSVSRPSRRHQSITFLQSDHGYDMTLMFRKLKESTTNLFSRPHLPWVWWRAELLRYLFSF